MFSQMASSSRILVLQLWGLNLESQIYKKKLKKKKRLLLVSVRLGTTALYYRHSQFAIELIQKTWAPAVFWNSVRAWPQKLSASSWSLVKRVLVKNWDWENEHVWEWIWEQRILLLHFQRGTWFLLWVGGEGKKPSIVDHTHKYTAEELSPRAISVWSRSLCSSVSQPHCCSFRWYCHRCHHRLSCCCCSPSAFLLCLLF